MLSKNDLDFKGVDLDLDFPLIAAKTNAGKTTFALKDLRPLLEDLRGGKYKRTIFLTPYRRTYQQIVNDERFIQEIQSIDSLGGAFADDGKIYVATYSKICSMLADNAIDLSDNLVIFDEIHRLAQFSTYQPQMSFLLEWLEDADLWGNFTAIGLTGTPQPIVLYNDLDYSGFEFKIVTKVAQQNITAGSGLIIHHGSAESAVKRAILDGKKGLLVYVQSATKAIKLCRTFKAADYKAAFVISEYNDTIDDLTKERYSALMDDQIFDGLSIAEWIDRRSDIPSDLDVLIINGAAVDGINILDRSKRIKEVIVESCSSADIEQARARVRHDIEQLTIVQTCGDYNAAFEDLAHFDLSWEKHEQHFFDDLISTLTEIMREQEQSAFDAMEVNAMRNKQTLDGDLIAAKKRVLPCAVLKGAGDPFFNLLGWCCAKYTVDHLFDDPYKLLAQIKDMFDDPDSVEIIDGSDFIQETKNKIELSDTDKIIAAFGLDKQSEVELTKEDLSSIIEKLDLWQTKRRKAGKTTALKLLEPYFDISKRRKRLNGSQKLIYTICAKK